MKKIIAWVVGVGMMVALAISISTSFSPSFFSELGRGMLAAVMSIFDDQLKGTNNLNVEVANNPGFAYSGSQYLKFSLTDQWHPLGRLDLGQKYTMVDPNDRLEFFLRSASGTYSGPIFMRLMYSGAGDTSSDIDIRPYLTGGQLSESYQSISIPKSAIGGNFQGYFRTFYLLVPAEEAKKGVVLYLDYLNLKTIDAPVPVATTTITTSNNTTQTSPTVATASSTVTTLNTTAIATTPTTVSTATTTAKKISATLNITSIERIIFDEVADKLTYANMTLVTNQALAFSGQKYFQATMPDRWHPVVRLSHPPVSFVSSQTNNLQFALRTASGTYSGPIFLKLMYVGESDASQDLDIRPYLAGGVVTEKYQRLVIPRSALGGNFKGYFARFYLMIPSNQVGTGKTFLLDAISLDDKVAIPEVIKETDTVVAEPVFQEVTASNIFFDDSASTTRGSNISLTTDLQYVAHGQAALKFTVPANSSTGLARLTGDKVVTFSTTNSDTLALSIRTDAGTYNGPIAIRLYRSSAADTSQDLDIRPYLAGGVVTEKYQRINIPRSAFVGNFQGYFGTLYLVLPKLSPTAQSFYLDYITLENHNGFTIESVDALDNKHLMVTVDKPIDFVSARDLGNYLVQSEDGLNKLAVEKIGLRSWVTGFSGPSSNSAIIKHYIYLTLATPIDNVRSYKLSLNVKDKYGNLPKAGDKIFNFNFDQKISSSIKVNQVGYLPTGVKRAYVGNYLGDGGAMTLSSGQIGYIKDESGKTVFSAPLQKATENDIEAYRPLSGEEVWTLDFSSLQTPGRYYVQVPSMGRSYTFEIGTSIYKDVFFKTARSLFFQRSGMNLTSAHAGVWSRLSEPKTGADGKPLAAYIHNSIKDKSPLLDDGTPAGTYVEATGGWYDAGDFNRYTRTAALAIENLLSYYELKPANFTDSQLNLPESGNGIPDILDEAKYELDWLTKMVGTNGCASNKISYETWPNDIPSRTTGKLWMITRTTGDTAAAAAALAQAARVYRTIDPASAKIYQDKANLAWQCLEKNPQAYPVIPDATSQELFCNPNGNSALGIPNIHSGCYYPYKYYQAWDLDQRAWAALEMFLMTGEKVYEDKFIALVPTTRTNGLANWVLKDYYVSSVNPMRAFLYYYKTTDSARKTEIMNGFKRLMTAREGAMNKWPYKVAEHTIRNVGFGTFSMATRDAQNFLLYYELTKDPKYYNLALRVLDVELGANPLSISFITGVGANPVKNPMVKVIAKTDPNWPIPGYPVYGPADTLPYQDYYNKVLDNAYPAFYPTSTTLSYPVGRKFVDNEMIPKFAEYVINDLTQTAGVFGYFSK